MEQDLKTDYARWSNPDLLSPDWNGRARFASGFIRPGLSILDIGCGAMAVEAIFAASGYTPCDVVARDERTRVIDLNDAALPTEWLTDIDLVTMLGVFEYLSDSRAVMRTIAESGKPLVTSYNPIDFGPETDRAGDGWLSSFTIAEFEAAARDSGLSIVWRYAFSDREFVYLFAPEGTDTPTVSALTVPTRANIVTHTPTERPSIMVAGFYGRGNCGDEALLQVIYETFSDTFDIVISLDEHGTAQGYWDWYPYDRCRRVHQGNLAHPAFPMAGVIVGGGGLPLGYVADQIFAARSVGTPIAFAGVDYPHNSVASTGSAAIAEAGYLGLYDYVALRSRQAVTTAGNVGRSVTYGADWALRLVSDESPDIATNDRRALVVLREFPLRTTAIHYIEEIARLVAGLRENGYDPFLMPFCPEDERFTQAIGADLLMPSEKHWWNARRVKQLIAQSGLVVSVGRLHPMIFAASTRTPVIQVCPPLHKSVDPSIFSKIIIMSQEFDVPYFATVDEALAAIASDSVTPSGEAALSEAGDRLATMIAEIRTLFS